MTNKTIVVGISDMAISSDPAATIITYSLGSCLGVTVYDPVSHLGGMIHCMLPLSNIDQPRAEKTPAMFVDVGVPVLFQSFFAAGGNRSRMIVKAAGCAQLLDPKGYFKIGERNFTLLRKLLWKNGILLSANSTGGSVSRTMILHIGSGKTIIKSQGTLTEL